MQYAIKHFFNFNNNFKMPKVIKDEKKSWKNVMANLFNLDLNDNLFLTF